MSEENSPVEGDPNLLVIVEQKRQQNTIDKFTMLVDKIKAVMLSHTSIRHEMFMWHINHNYIVSVETVYIDKSGHYHLAVTYSTPNGVKLVLQGLLGANKFEYAEFEPMKAFDHAIIATICEGAPILNAPPTPIENDGNES